MSTNPPGPPGEPPRPVPGKSCDSAECVDALAKIQDARNRILFKCAQVAQAIGHRNTLATIAGALWTLAVAAAAAAAAATGSVLGIPLAFLLFWLAVTFAATALLFSVLAAIAAIRVTVLEGELNGLRSDFTNATAAVTANCPPSCWGDLALPACPP